MAKSRLDKVRQTLDSTPLYLTDPANVFYLTGFHGTNGQVLLSDAGCTLVTDARYIDAARQLSNADLTVVESNQPLEWLTQQGLTALAFENTLPYKDYDALSSVIPHLTPLDNPLMPARQLKEPTELAKIRKACEISDEAFRQLLHYIEPGRTELDVANFLDFKMRELGASGVSFETIVASGKRSSFPHGVATTKPIAFGDAVTLDFGCVYEHYVSDMTRTIFVGEASDRLSNVYAAVLTANEALTAAARPGLTFADYDQIPRQSLEKLGYGEYFTHGIGHGIGLDIHETPYFSRLDSAHALQESMTITNEPGVYLPDAGGVRIEDDLLITTDGCEVLTKSSRQLIVV